MILLTAGTHALAQTYPRQAPITLIVPFR